MSDTKTEHMNDHLSEPTSIFGLSLWVVLGVCVGAAFVLVLVLISLYLASKRSKNKSLQTPTIPIVSKEIQEIRVDHVRTQVQAYPNPEPDPAPRIERQALLKSAEEESPTGYQKVHIDIGKDHRITYVGKINRMEIITPTTKREYAKNTGYNVVQQDAYVHGVATTRSSTMKIWVQEIHNFKNTT